MHKRTTHAAYPAFLECERSARCMQERGSVYFLQLTAAYLADYVEEAYTRGAREHAPFSGKQKESFLLVTFLSGQTGQWCR